MPKDAYGLTLGTASAGAAAAYVEGVERLLSAWPGAQACLERALAEDEGFALAHAALARLHLTYARMPQARACAAQARTLAAGTSRRERQHVEAIALLADGTPAKSLAAVRQHVAEFPRDALVLSLALGAFGLIAFSGRKEHDAERLAFTESLAAAYGEDWWFLMYRGWAHTEADAPEAGRRYCERSLELRRANAHGAHVLAHSFHERGDLAGASAFMHDWLPAYDRAGLLHCHLSWHQALLELECGRPGQALELYELHMRPGASQSPPLNILSDSAALLWRIALYFPAPRLPWNDVAAFAASAYPRAGAHFADVHAAMAAAGAGDVEALERRVAELRALDAQGKLAPGAVVPELCLALLAFARGDYEQVIRIAEPIQDDIVRIGGSRAQRDVHEDTLIVAYLRTGRIEQAHRLLNRRIERRPSARDAQWLRQTDH